MKKFLICLLAAVSFIIGNHSFALGDEPSDYYHYSSGGKESLNYSYNNYLVSDAINYSYLYYENGNFIRVEYIDKQIYIETYDSSFKLVSSKILEMQLPIYGGAFSGQKYNFIVVGQLNNDDEADKEVVRVIKYDKQWNELDSLSYYGINTSIPFYAGTLVFDEIDGYLYIKTSHQMFADSEGLKHQANLRFIVEEETLTDYLKRYEVSNPSTGYVSHSFSQLITHDDAYYYTADLGDGFPRGVYIAKVNYSSLSPVKSANVYGAYGNVGENSTGISVGALAVSNNSILTAINSVAMVSSASYDPESVRNIILLVTDKENISAGNTALKQITDYDDASGITVFTPELVKINDNKFLLMWAEYDGSGCYARMVLVNGQGEYLSKIIRIGAALSDCKPITVNERAIWYVTGDLTPTFYDIDCSDVTRFEKLDGMNVIDRNFDFPGFTWKMNESGTFYTTSYNGSFTEIDFSILDRYPGIARVAVSNVLSGNDVLEKVIFSDKMTAAPEFTNCVSLKEVVFTDSVRRIPVYAFYKCGALRHIDIPDRVESIENLAFYASSIEEINLPSSLKTIGYRVFDNCTALKKVTFNSEVRFTDAHGLFNSCQDLQEINFGKIDTSEMTNMAEMFAYCSSLVKLDMGSFDTGKVTEMRNAFAGCKNLREVFIPETFTIWKNDACLPAGSWVHDDLEFSEIDLAALFTLNNKAWAGTWYRETNYAVLKENGDLVLFRSHNLYKGSDTVQKVADYNGVIHEGYVYSCPETYSETAAWKERESEIKKVYVADGNIIRVKYLKDWFSNLPALKEFDGRGIVTTDLENMAYMFLGCHALEKVDFSTFDTAKVTTMTDLFTSCDKLSVIVLGKDFDNWRSQSYLPYGIWTNGSLKKTEIEMYNEYPQNAADWAGEWRKEIPYAVLTEQGDLVFLHSFNIVDAVDEVQTVTDLTGHSFRGIVFDKIETGIRPWYEYLSDIKRAYVAEGNIIRPQNMDSYFANCNNLSSVDLRGFDTSNTTTMTSLFFNCTGLKELDVSMFDTSKVGNLSYMFSGCQNIKELDVSVFDTAQALSMNYMFYDCGSLETIYASESFVVDSLCNTASMFRNCRNLVGGNGTVYDFYHIDGSYAHIDTEGDPGYFTLNRYEVTWNWAQDGSKATLNIHDLVNDTTVSLNATVTSEKTPVTCESDGVIIYTAEAEYNGKTYTDTLKVVYEKAWGHDYEVTWIWSEDCLQATAIFTCKHDISHTSRLEAAVTVEVNEAGTVYQAKAVFQGKEYVSRKIIPVNKTIRIFGDNRYETSLKTAEELRSVLGVDKFDAVVLTTGSDFADALSGSYLANKNKAPVILIRDNAKKTPYLDNVINYIKEHVSANGTVYVLGGVNAVPEEWLKGLAGYKVTRLEGSNRYTTNIEVLNEVGYTGGDILVCTGKDFADSLSASAVDLPILLVNGTGSLSKTQKTYLESLSNVRFHIIGGEAAVSKDIENALASYGTVVDRIAGGARYETSALIAEKFFGTPDKAVLAYGHNFPDGLGGGALAYALKSPLILAGSSKSRSRFAIEYCTGKGITSGYVLGGNTLISDDYVREIYSLEDEIIIVEK